MIPAMQPEEQESLQAANDFDFVKTSASAVVFLLSKLDPNAIVFRVWGLYAIRVRHLIAAINKLFGPLYY